MSDSLQALIAREVSTYFNYDSPIPFQIETVGGVTYKRWSANEDVEIFIARSTVIGNTTTNDFTIALWSDRATASYVYNR